MTPVPERLRITGASIRLDSMPRDGRDLDLTVDKPERDGLAVELGVLSLDRPALRADARRFFERYVKLVEDAPATAAPPKATSATWCWCPSLAWACSSARAVAPAAISCNACPSRSSSA